MSKRLVERLSVSRSVEGELYSQLVEVWESIVAENTRELHLVDESSKRTWLSFKDSFTARLIAAGEEAVQLDRWNNPELIRLRDTIVSASYTSGSVLDAQKKASTVATVETKGLLNRLKGLLKA